MTELFTNEMQSWFPNSAISWYSVSKELESISYTNHDNRFGMGPNANVYERYLLSFYWVAATITSNGSADFDRMEYGFIPSSSHLKKILITSMCTD